MEGPSRRIMIRFELYFYPKFIEYYYRSNCGSALDLNIHLNLLCESIIECSWSQFRIFCFPGKNNQLSFKLYQTNIELNVTSYCLQYTPLTLIRSGILTMLLSCQHLKKKNELGGIGGVFGSFCRNSYCSKNITLFESSFISIM